ncbi:hypothetical protein KEM55_007259 [Ascosphaera atra]|nr:hypothetical protein KEM55_007259 [Ascosphaera atra]
MANIEPRLRPVDVNDHSNSVRPVSMADPEVAERARQAGWAEPQPYDYARYNVLNCDVVNGSEFNANGKFPEWASGAIKYEWNDTYGDIGPRDENLEHMLFHADHLQRPGNYFETLREIKVTAETTEQPDPITNLMGKARKLAAARPNLANGFDPVVDSVRAEPLVLIVAPTRELSTQIFDEARRLCYRSMLRPCVVYGGAPVREQRVELQKGCDVLIGTPGRLLGFMEKPHLLSLHRVRYTIIDEADEMLQADWEDEFSKLMSGGDLNEDADHNYLMFSATFNKQCRQLARKYLAADHVRIRIEEHLKKQCLYDLLINMPPARTLIFVNTKQQADFLDDYLFNMRLPSTSIHSDRTQREREDALRAFRSARCPILVATGVSARGLDIKNVVHVINFDLPSMQHGSIDEYIHRIGRTARIGNKGLATSFYNHDRNSDIAHDLVKILLECGQDIPDFLQNDKPLDGKLVFHDDTDDDEDDPTATQIATVGADAWRAEEGMESGNLVWGSVGDGEEGWTGATAVQGRVGGQVAQKATVDLDPGAW